MKRPIIVDSREKKPYKFPGQPTEVRTLDVGDYTLDGYADTFAVERKTLDDLANSLGTDRERFEDEINRAQSLDEFVVVIESDKNAAQRGEYFSNIHPNSVVATVEQWPARFSTLEFTWEQNRQRAAQETLRLLDKWYLERVHGT